jgi:hypothetical protein
MGRKSPKLEAESEAVVALLKYIKQQSKMTLLQLEYKFTPRKETEESKRKGKEDNHGGRGWWRWLQGKNQPGIELVTALFSFASEQLITGEWEENGNESNWVGLLPAVIDSRYSIFIDKKSTFLKILEELQNPFLPQPSHSWVTNKMLRAVSAGYYIPRDEDIRNIFWSKPNELDACYKEHEYIPRYRVWPTNDDDRKEMEILLTDILANFGMPAEDHIALEEYARDWGLVGNDLMLWSDQVQHQIQFDAQLLSNISKRMEYLYPSEFKYTDSTDDDSVKIAKRSHFKMVDELAMVARKFHDYSEMIDSISKPSRMYGTFSKLSYSHFKFNGCKQRIGWDFPTIEII